MLTLLRGVICLTTLWCKVSLPVSIRWRKKKPCPWGSTVQTFGKFQCCFRLGQRSPQSGLGTLMGSWDQSCWVCYEIGPSRLKRRQNKHFSCTCDVTVELRIHYRCLCSCSCLVYLRWSEQSQLMPGGSHEYGAFFDLWFILRMSKAHKEAY